MATLRKRKDRGNRWMLTYLDVDGRMYRIDTHTTDKKLAEIWLRKAEELISRAKIGDIPKVGRIDKDVIAGKKPEEKSLTLSEFKDKYIELCKYDFQLSKKSIELNELALNSLIKVVSDKSLSQVSEDDVVLWKKTLTEEGRTPEGIGVYFRHLRAAWNRAMQRKLTQFNPFLIAVEPKRKKRQKKEKAMSPEEVKKVLDAIRDEGDKQFEQFILFLLNTGARRNEILFLKWKDINIEKRQLRINAEKTGKELDVPINDALMSVINEMEKKEEGYVFVTHSKRRGAKKGVSPWSPDYVTHHFKDYITSGASS